MTIPLVYKQIVLLRQQFSRTKHKAGWRKSAKLQDNEKGYSIFKDAFIRVLSNSIPVIQ